MDLEAVTMRQRCSVRTGKKEDTKLEPGEARRMKLCATGWLWCLIAGVAQAASGACEPAGDIHFICGLTNAEDLVRLAGTPWVVATEKHTGAESSLPGALRAVRIDSHAVQELYPGTMPRSDPDRRSFANCPGPPGPSFNSHGLNVRVLGRGQYRLYVVNHGGRESIEVFDLSADGRHVSARWRGCAVSPDGIVLNAVAPLSGEGFVATSTRAPPADGGLAGAVMTWRPAEGWRRIRNLVANDNGIEVSSDGRWVFVAGFDEMTINRFALDTGMAQRVTLHVDFGPDNIRWGDDGALYVAGSTIASYAAAVECGLKPVCDAAYTVLRVDPDTMHGEVVMQRPGIPGVFGAATTALKIGDTIWSGSFRGDRVAVFPIRPITPRSQR